VTDSGNASGDSALWTQETIDRREVSDKLSRLRVNRAGTFDSRTHYFSEAAKRRSRCGSVRGMPVQGSHFSPGLAPHVEQRTIRACPMFAFITTHAGILSNNMVNSDQPATPLWLNTDKRQFQKRRA
jgi:hypothetical protein